MTQLVEVKRYNSIGQFLYAYSDEVTIKDSPKYPDLKCN